MHTIIVLVIVDREIQDGLITLSYNIKSHMSLLESTVYEVSR